MISDALKQRLENTMWAVTPYSEWKIKINHGKCHCCETKILQLSIQFNGRPISGDYGEEIEGISRGVPYEIIQANEHDLENWCRKVLEPIIALVRKNEDLGYT